MKTLRFLTMLILGCTLAPVSAQKIPTHKIWVTLVNQQQEKGTFYAATEQELVILKADLTQLKLLPENIQIIKIRRQGNVGKGAWMGAVGGAVIGAVIGMASTQDAYITQGEGALIGGLIGTPVGALVGAGIYSGREKYLTNGNKEIYLSFLPKLQQYEAF